MFIVASAKKFSSMSNNKIARVWQMFKIVLLGGHSNKHKHQVLLNTKARRIATISLYKQHLIVPHGTHTSIT